MVTEKKPSREKLFLGVGLGLTLVCFSLILLFGNQSTKDLTLKALAPLAIGIPALIVKNLEVSMRKQSAQRIDEAEKTVKEEPRKAKPAWDLARITLGAYFDRNLSQITWIFWLSLSVMFAGLGVIIWGISDALSLATHSPDKLDSIKSLPSIIAALAGIITEFIGATFLFIYRSTIQQAALYSQTLERINSVGMAMQILDTMPDETKKGDLKSETKAKLVELLVKGANKQEHEEQKLKAVRSRKRIVPKAAQGTD